MRAASLRHAPRPAWLASALVLLLVPAVSASADGPTGPAPAATIPVGNCNDHGPGSLRAAVAGAASGDRIDLSALACGRIVLTSRAIQVAQDDLEFVGRSPWSLTIDGNRTGRVFRHTGTGTLRLRRLSIANGYVTGTEVSGGCILSQGSVELIGSRLHHCRLRASGGLAPFASGGGIQAARVSLSYSHAYANAADVVDNGSEGGGGAVSAIEVALYHSQVYGNRAVEGGGVYGGSVTANHSSIHDNQAEGAGGGIYVSFATLTLRRSTVAANRGGVGGGFSMRNADGPALIVESTVSDNVAQQFGAGVLPFNREAGIFNSTIAFNQAQPALAIIECSAAIDGWQLRLESSIVARNTCRESDYDISGDPSFGSRITGGNNLIGSSDLPVPPDTITAAPRLGPLTDNGGPTRTRKPLAGSPALERGSNPRGALYDQRGPGFPRVKNGFPDIGAVER